MSEPRRKASIRVGELPSEIDTLNIVLFRPFRSAGANPTRSQGLKEAVDVVHNLLDYVAGYRHVDTGSRGGR